MLTTIKNGGRTHKDVVHVPFSKFKHAIANVLLAHGYIASFDRKKRATGDILEIGIKYVNGKPRVHDVKRISKLSRRMYARVKDLQPVKQGHGAIVLSTPKGVMVDEQARKEQVGGEVLFEIW